MENFRDIRLSEFFKSCDGDNERVFLFRLLRAREEIKAYIDLYHSLKSSNLDKDHIQRLIVFLSTKYYIIFYEFRKLLFDIGSGKLNEVSSKVIKKINPTLYNQINWDNLFIELSNPRYRNLRVSGAHMKTHNGAEVDKELEDSIIQSIRKNSDDELKMVFLDDKLTQFDYDGSSYFLLNEMDFQLEKASNSADEYIMDLTNFLDIHKILTMFMSELINSI